MRALLLFALFLGVFSEPAIIDVGINSEDAGPFPDCAPHHNTQHSGNYFTAVNQSQISPHMGEIKAGQWTLCLVNHEHRRLPVQIIVQTLNKEIAMPNIFPMPTAHMRTSAELMVMEYKPVIMFERNIPVCGDTCFFELIAFHTLCFQEGKMQFHISLLLLDNGTQIDLTLNKTCLAHEVSYYGSTDYGHLAPPLGFLFYCTFILLQCLNLSLPLHLLVPAEIRRRYRLRFPATESSNDYAAQMLNMVRGENVMFILVGGFLVLILSSDFQMIMHHEFPKHLIFGMFFLMFGLLGRLLATDTLNGISFPFTSPMVFMYIGYAFMAHPQYDSFSVVMHNAFGAVLILVGLLRGFSLIFPQLTLLCALLGHFACAIFMGTDHDYVLVLQGYGVEPMNYIFLILNVVVLYVLTIVFIAFLIARCQARKSKVYTPLGSVGSPVPRGKEKWEDADL